VDKDFISLLMKEVKYSFFFISNGTKPAGNQTTLLV
jgi:hypothetical protein